MDTYNQLEDDSEDEYDYSNFKNNEVSTLLEIKNNIELRIIFLQEMNVFNERLNNFDTGLSDFISTYVKENVNNSLEIISLKYKLKYLQDNLKNIEQQIKAVCKHNYKEDYIDNCCSKSNKITYCSICYSTF